MASAFSMNSFLGQRILALVRDGDYAHAGEEEAIELAMADVAKDAGRLILDAGCGRGGTAEYLRRHGWGRVTGFDIQAESIAAARQRYPECRFLVCDVADADRAVDEAPDVICLFNAYYCFPDQAGALRALARAARAARAARPGTRLILFDHVDRGGYQDSPLLDAGEPFLRNPPLLAAMPERLAAAGWRTAGTRELHDRYIGWYRTLVGKIERSRGRIIEIAGPEGYGHVLALYQGLVDAAVAGRLGAAIVTAERVG
ncbi:class I SAM-dependent methyltransferase [Inquilinus sp.]|uniref:class I SAM-dependent methyltransferase n=1 Tax=Inquilinus sp. TaxID=1932117 RepID=UPI0031DB40CF